VKKERVRSRGAALVPGLLLLTVVASACVVGWVRPRLLDQFGQLKQTSDTFALPSPDQSVVLSLGYRSALADLLFAHVLVSYGLHFQEKRRYEFVGEYLDVINALDPKFRTPYRIADTLLTLQPVAPRQRDYDKAREVLERGLRALPHDTELWNTAGQYLAYLAPPQIKDEEKKQAFRLAGARVLARACELVGANENIPYHCITAAGLLTRGGHQEATIQFLERVLAVNDDPNIRRLALAYLEKAAGEQERRRAEQRHQAILEIGEKDLPFVSKDRLLVLGPPFDPASCAGVIEPPIECSSSWRAWGHQQVY